jgi:hypothetical protein
MSGNGTRIQLSDDWTDGGWFSFPRRFARDRSLSWKAKGIAGLLASHSATFVFSATELEKWAKDGRDGTAAGIRELESAGYLRRERQSSGEMVYRLFPEPQTEKPEEAGRKPLPENPVPEKPSTEKPGVYKETTPKETTKGQEDTPGDISAMGSLFEVPGAGLEKGAEDPGTEIPEAVDFPAFWAEYPLRKAKQAALRAWGRALQRVPKADRAQRAADILEGAKRYAKERADQPAQFTKHPATWLNGGCWEDEAAPVGSGNPPGGYQQYRDEDLYPDAAPWFDPATLED